MQDYGFNAGSKAVGYVTSPQQFDSELLQFTCFSLGQWFLTGGTRTPWGYQTPQQGYGAPTFLGIHALKILKMCCRLLRVQ